jgi:hypothetical protein
VPGSGIGRRRQAERADARDLPGALAGAAGDVGPFRTMAVGWIEGGSQFTKRLWMPRSSADDHVHERQVVRGATGPGFGDRRAADSRCDAALPETMRLEVSQLEGPIDDVEADNTANKAA